jgi:hypothetical protein
MIYYPTKSNTLIIIIFSVTIGIFLISLLLQILLSKKENKKLGFIIPMIYFVFSILNVINNLNFNNIIKNLITGTSIFIFSNIFTVIFLVIYFYYRKKIKIKSKITTMKIKDL